MGEFRLEESKEMKDTRETEMEEKELEITPQRGWCICVILYIWDCLKVMGKGFRFDNEDHYQRPRGNPEE